MAALGGSFDRIEPFSVSIPANTPKVSPVERQCTFAPGKVVLLEVLVPPGHNGQTGFAVAQAHQPIYPAAAGVFVVASGEKFEWDMADDIDSGDWQLFGYNTSKTSHSFYLRFYVEELTKRSGLPALAAPIVL